MVLFLYLLYISEKGVRREPTGGEDGVVVVTHTHTHTYLHTHTYTHTHTYLYLRKGLDGSR